MFFIIISVLHVSGGFSAHNQELIKCMYILGYYHAFLLSTAGVDGLGVVISNISTPVLHRRKACFGRYFRPSSGAYKTVCAALGIVMFSCCLPLVVNGLEPNHTSGRQQESMIITKVAHTVL